MIFKVIKSSNSITLFWINKIYVNNAEYNVYLNNELVASTNKTHISFEGLYPNKTYNVSIELNNKVIAKKVIKTLKNKNTITLNEENFSSLTIKERTRNIQTLINNNIGSKIIFTSGIYTIGSIFLPSNTHLYLEEGAIIQGSSSLEDYLPKIHSRFEGIENESYASLINMGILNNKKKYTTKNITIEGKGKIIGGGLSLLEEIIQVESEKIDPDTIDNSKVSIKNVAGRFRNRLINVSNCKNVLIKGLTVGQSASWNIHPIYSKNIIVTDCFIDSYVEYLFNNDGIDPDSCSNVYIFNNKFNTGDDCIAIKSGKNPEGNKINRPSKNIYIFDCEALKGHGCSIGSEISGGVKNVHIYDCNFEKTMYGLHVKTTLKRGAFVKDLFVNNSTFSRIAIYCVDYNDDGESSNKITLFKNFYITDCDLTSIRYRDETDYSKETAINIQGFEDYPKNFKEIYLDHITVNHKTYTDDDIILKHCLVTFK